MTNQIRSDELWFAGYALSRLALPDGGPPAFLGVKHWYAAYDKFFDALSDGRGDSTFRNSLKNVRDAFDAFIETSPRAGWRSAEGLPPRRSGRLAQILDAWEPLDAERVIQEARSILEGGEPAALEVEGSLMTEGGSRVVHSRRAERNPAVRREAVRIHGTICQGCGFDFSATYGEWGDQYIEVHHVMPLAEHGQRETDPNTDLVVVCSNCHRMIHRRRGICLSIDELKAHIESAQFAESDGGACDGE